MKTITIIFALILGRPLSSYSQDRAFLSARSFLMHDSLRQQISWRPFDPPTIGVQLLSSTGTAGILLAATTAIAGKQSGHGDIIISSRDVVYFLGSVLVAVAVPVSVYYSGQWMGGNGTQTWTFLGALAGSGVGIVFIALPGNIPGEEILAYVAAMGIAGTLLGYHLSSSTVYQSGERNSMSTFPYKLNEPALFSVKTVQLVQISINF